MRRVWWIFLGFVALVSLAGCNGSWFEAREPWRREAEEQCLKSGAVKESPAIAMLRPIQGPGMCGADFPLKVVALGENEALGYAENLRPPGLVPQGAPRPSAYPSRGVSATPPSAPSQNYPGYSPQPSYSSQPAAYEPPAARGPMSLDPQGSGGPNSPTRYQSVERAPLDGAPDGGHAGAYDQRPFDASRSTYGARDIIREEPLGRGAAQDDDFDDDPRNPVRRQPYPQQPRYGAPATTVPAPSPRMNPLPSLGPQRPVQTTAAVSPAATLACPIVSALDTWIKDSVQPSAQHWFNQPVVEIKQISAYSCRGMNGQPGARISEHAFGNALDIAAFVLADGRKVTVKNGWRGSPEEQGFLRDIQAAACEMFTTVLAPGSNAFHYDHIHVDLMRRSSGRRICQPGAVSGEEIAARAARNGSGYARHQEQYPPAARREMIDPNNDPFAWRGRRDQPTGSIKTAKDANSAKSAKAGRGPVDDEHILDLD